MSLALAMLEVIGFNVKSELIVSGLEALVAGLMPEPVVLPTAFVLPVAAGEVDLLSVVAHAPKVRAVSKSRIRQHLAITGVVFIKTCFSIHAGCQMLLRHPI